MNASVGRTEIEGRAVPAIWGWNGAQRLSKCTEKSQRARGQQASKQERESKVGSNVARTMLVHGGTFREGDESSDKIDDKPCVAMRSIPAWRKSDAQYANSEKSWDDNDVMIVGEAAPQDARRIEPLFNTQ